MDRPRLVLLAGAPGSGKTTLGRLLASELRLPFVARDEIRGGLAFTAGVWGDDFAGMPSGDEAVGAFLTTIEGLLATGVSCIAEYVVRADRPEHLDRLTAAGDVVVVLTSCPDSLDRLAVRHRNERLIANPNVLSVSGAADPDEQTQQAVARMRAVEREMQTHFAQPTLDVDTTDGYEPDLESIIAFVTASSGPDG